jgi:carboxyl-terminal processing protease
MKLNVRGIKMRHKILIIALLTAALIQVLILPGSEQEIRRETYLSQMIYQSLEELHYSKKKIDDDFSEKAFWNYLNYLDFNKRFLLQEDIKAVEKYKYKIDDDLAAGRLDLMKEVSKRLKSRIDQVKALVPEILNRPFDFTREEYVELDADKREYCETEEQLREYWRKILKYRALTRYLNLLESDKALKGKGGVTKEAALEEKARKSVEKSVTAMLNRLLQADQTDHQARYFNALLNVFDPHSSYLAPKKKDDFDIEMSGQLEGIGALLGESDGFVKVVSIVPGGPSWRQKQLEAGDLILKVGQGDEEAVDVVGMRVEDAVKLIRGKKGTLVRLTVKKPDGRIMEIPIVRDVVIIEETFARSTLLKEKKSKNKIGYIALPRFYNDFTRKDGRNSTDDVKKELEKLKKRGVDGIILDLRNNSGGALQDAIRMSGLFINKGPVVQVKDRRHGVRVLKDPDAGIVYGGPLVVMINALSASASEILAAALQDYGRAVIVGGSSSFGKGTVQVLMDLDRYILSKAGDFQPLGALTLTIQKFYRITGGSNQYKGIIPDIVLPDRFDYLEIGEKYLDYPLKWDSIKAASYQKWHKGSANLSSLYTASQARISSNQYFKLNSEYIETLKSRREDTLQSLNLNEVKAQQEQLKQELDRLEQLDKKSTDFDIISLRQTAPGTPKRLKEENTRREREWFKKLDQDVMLAEAVHITTDLVKMQK